MFALNSTTNVSTSSSDATPAFDPLTSSSDNSTYDVQGDSSGYGLPLETTYVTDESFTGGVYQNNPKPFGHTFMVVYFISPTLGRGSTDFIIANTDGNLLDPAGSALMGINGAGEIWRNGVGVSSLLNIFEGYIVTPAWLVAGGVGLLYHQGDNTCRRDMRYGYVYIYSSPKVGRSNAIILPNGGDVCGEYVGALLVSSVLFTLRPPQHREAVHVVLLIPYNVLLTWPAQQ